jgi:2-polyprenyl-3-methyl-5-hydroxy-6-metoxy-1,4-benzoquinol methylase
MAEDSGQSVLSSLTTILVPGIQGLHDKLTRGSRVLDVGCGSGKAMIALAMHYPNSQFVGYDLCEEPIHSANDEVKSRGLSNVTFEVKDMTNAEIDRKFDVITAFDSIHDQARPDIVLDFIFNSLADDGIFLMQDIDAHTEQHKNIEHPLGSLLYTISCMHCMTVSLAQGGMGLGAMWGEEKAVEMLKDAGFTSVEIQRFEHDIQNCYYTVSKQGK